MIDDDGLGKRKRREGREVVVDLADCFFSQLDMG